MGSTEEITTIPTIDIGPMLDPNSSKQARLAVVEALCNACHVYGFFNLVGHGIPRESLREAFELNKMFFALPEDKKMEVSISKSVGRSFRGYEPAGIQTHHKGLLPDTKEVCTFLPKEPSFNILVFCEIEVHTPCPESDFYGRP